MEKDDAAMLKIDHSLIIQIANFLFLLFVLNIILYRPIRRILGQRRAEMDSFENMIGDLQNKSDSYEKELEDNIAEARKTGRDTKDGLKSDGFEREKTMLQDASSTAGEKIEKARQEMERRMADVRKSLHDEVSLFSKELAEKVLGRSF